jgi:hypothetical protein
MKKTAPKKMMLSRETLGILSDQEMKEILGAVSSDTHGTKDVCCA